MNRPYSLMIDPGHGGADPGALNERLQLKEKDVVLNIALIMHKIVAGGDYLFIPFMTRIWDKYVSLEDRCTKANELNIGAFLSIHTNARPRKGKPGIEIEAWKYPGSEKGQEFGQILIDYILNAVSPLIPVYSRGVKEGSFYVLKHTKMPAVIIELGFLTDDEEARFLIGWKNQRIIARALADASEFFLEGGPS